MNKTRMKYNLKFFTDPYMEEKKKYGLFEII